MTKKSYICEEDETHLRILFWHLLMNLKNQKIRILKKCKKHLHVTSF